MTALPVERIRVAAERRLGRALSSRMGVNDSVAPHDGVRLVRSSGVLLTSEGAPGHAAVLDEVCERLGCTDRVELYASKYAGEGVADACYLRDPKAIVIAIAPRTLEATSGGELRCILGHEIGHALAHANTGYQLAREACDADDPELRKLGLSLSTACELTADRFGLLACRDPMALVRLEMMSCTESSADALLGTPEAFLTQAREVIEPSLIAGD